MKIFTYARTLWYEFWMWLWVGSASKEPVLPIATVIPSPELRSAMNKKVADVHSKIDFESIHFPEETTRVWIYNVSRLTHEMDHPLLHHVSIRGNHTRKRYCMYTSLPSIVMAPQQEFGDVGEISVTAVPMDGRRLAMDLICPDNLTLDIDAEVKGTMSIGRDLRKKGVFWSEHNPPKPAEVKKAIKKMEDYYTDLLERARLVELSDNRRELSNYITPEHHEAAEYFQISTSWHPIIRKPDYKSKI